MWVFINGQLPSSLDIGGSHEKLPSPRTLNLDTLGLHVGHVYPIDIFFADQQSAKSVFDIATSIDLIPAKNYVYHAAATDADRDKLHWSLLNPLPNMRIDADTGELIWTTAPQVGTYPITIQVSDGKGGIDTQAYQLQVVDGDNASVSGTVFNDVNQNGTLDSGEQGSANVTVFADLNHNGTLDLGEYSTETTSSGNYSLIQLPGGVYPITVVSPTGYAQTNASHWRTVTLDPGHGVTGQDFGISQDSAVNAKPVFHSTPPRAVAAGQLFIYEADVSDADDAALFYDLALAPSGMEVERSTGIVAWRPKYSQIGSTNQVILRASDGHGGYALQKCDVSVIAQNDPPVISSRPVGPAKVGVPFTYQVSANDPNSDALTYSIDPKSSANGVGMSSSGELTWTPTVEGSFPIRVIVTDARGGRTDQPFNLPVYGATVNTPPHIDSHPPTKLFVGHLWTYNAHAWDVEDGITPNPGVISFELDEKAEQLGMHLNNATGEVQWTPQQAGTFTVTVYASDHDEYTTAQVLTLRVSGADSNRPPTFTSHPPLPAAKNQPWNYSIKTDDPDGDTITLSLVSFTLSNGEVVAPADYTFNPTAGLLTWTHPSTIGSPARIELKAVDSQNAQRTQAFDLPVLSNSPPVIRGGVELVGAKVGSASTMDFEVADSDNDTLSFQLLDVNGTALPAAFMQPAAGQLRCAYTPSAVGTQTLRLRVSDGKEQVEHYFQMVVQSSGSTAPVVSYSAPSAVAAGDTFAAQPTATDPSGYTLSYALEFISGQPEPTGMTIDSNTGLITWTPTSADIGPVASPYKYQIVVSNGHGSSVRTPISSLSVVARLHNTAPAITSDPSGIRASDDRPFIYAAAAEDAEHEMLRWTLVEGPATAHIGFTTGEFVWQPKPDEFGQDQFAIIQVSDPHNSSAQQRIELTGGTSYLPVNACPRIASIPPVPGKPGQTYRYLIHADDPDGEKITFSLEGTSKANLTLTAIDDSTTLLEWVNPAASASRDFIVRATDERGIAANDGTGTTTQHIILNIANSNVSMPPLITSTPTYSAMIGEVYSYHVAATGVEAGAITFDTVTTLPAWLVMNAATGVLSGTPTASGSYDITVRATQNGASALQRFTLAVTNTLKPTLVVPPDGSITAVPYQAFSYQVVATGSSNHLTYWLIDSNGNLAVSTQDMTIDQDGRVRWTAPQAATNRSFIVRVVDSVTGAYDQQTFLIHIVADEAPTVSLQVTTREPLVGTSVGFIVGAGDDVGLADLRVVLHNAPGSSGDITLPVGSNGIATYSLPKGSAGATFSAEAVAVDTAGHEVKTSLQTMTVQAANPAAPYVSILAGDGAVFTKPQVLSGRIYDTDNDLVYYSLTAIPLVSSGNAITLLQAGTLGGATPISGLGHAGPGGDTTIQTITPFDLPNGAYTFKVFAQDAEGHERSVSFGGSVQSSSKLGDYSLSFTDLTASIGGVPISIVRTYDSQKAEQFGDFGYGWTLSTKQGGIRDLPTQPDPVLGQLGFKRAYEAGSRITVTLPDGSERGFTTVLLPDTSNNAAGALGLADLYLVAFLPDEDSGDCKLEFDSGLVRPVDMAADSGLPDNLGLPDALAEDGIRTASAYFDEETGELLEADGLPFNPINNKWRFHVESLDGTSYYFDSESGKLLEQSDRVGNTVIYSGEANQDLIEARDAAGTVLSKVEISRNTNGTINKIVWDDGDSHTNDILHYNYDATTGDLLSFADRSLATTAYEYNKQYDANGNPTASPLGREHFLTRINDNRGEHVLTAQFDIGTNRLTGLVDASGTTAGISYRTTIAGGLSDEIVSDVNSKTTEVVRDARGNVVAQIQQLEGQNFFVSRFEYDDRNNQTAVRKPYTIDEAFSGTDSRLIFNPEPVPVEYTSQTKYDDPQNPFLPTVVIDGAGNHTTYTYDGRGNVLSTTDPQGNVTAMTYDHDTGLLTQTTDASGNTTTFSYDSRGNVEKQLMRRLDGTSVMPASNCYNSLNQLEWTEDSNGHRRNFQYDGRGRQTATWHTVGGKVIKDETTYDEEDRVIETRRLIDEAGIGFTGTTEHDDFTDHRIMSHTLYDSSGRVLITTDRFGHEVVSRYDPRGHIVETRSAAKDKNGVDRVIVRRTAYDDNGRVIAVTDPFIEGVTTQADMRITQTIYDDAGRVQETRRLKNLTIGFTYLRGGTGTDHLDGVFDSTFVYDAASNTYAGGASAASVTLTSAKTHYDDLGQVDWSESETGLRTNFEYDDAGRQKKVWFDLDLERDGSAAEHHETVYDYDSAGRQTKIHTKLNGTTERVIEYVYDAAGRVTDTIQHGKITAAVDDPADDVVTRTIYDDAGRRTAEIDAQGRTTNYEYDASGRLIAVTLPEIDPSSSNPEDPGHYRPRYEYHYDALGNQTYIVSNIYVDEYNRKVIYLKKNDISGADEPKVTRLITDPIDSPPTNGTITQFTYDSDGHQLTHTLPMGFGSSGFVEANSYETTPGIAYGQLTYSTDFEGHITAYDYDNTSTGGGRLLATRYYSTIGDYQADTNGTNAARTIRYTYDELGRQVTVTDDAFGSQATAYDYWPDGQVKSVESPQGSLYYEYDEFGRKTKTWTVNPSNGVVTTQTEYGYDQLNRLVKTSSVRRFGASVDANSTLSGAQSDDTITYYDTSGQIDYELITNKDGTLLTKDIQYDSLGRTDLIQYFVDVGTLNHQWNSGETSLNKFEYTYYDDNSRASEVWTNQYGQGSTTSWTYDGLNRLVTETFDGSDPAEMNGSTPVYGSRLKYTDTFTYDLVGNRLQYSHEDRFNPWDPNDTVTGSAGPSSTTSYRYDANDRLLSETYDRDDTDDIRYTTYDYGGTGNPGTKVTKKIDDWNGAPDVMTTYTYDATGRMSSVTVQSGTTTTVSYKYDHNGVRVEQSDGTTTTIYHVDPANSTGYAQVLEEGTDSNSNHKLDGIEVAKAYVLGMQVLLQATKGSPEQVLNLLHDVHGSTRAVLDARGKLGVSQTHDENTVLQTYLYSAYGVDISLETAKTALRYSGEWIDPASGLSFNRARWYDPGTGRFTTVDPFGGNASNPISLHKYLYGDGNPIRAVDSTGMWSLAELLITMSGGESIDKLQSTYRGAKGALTAAKMLVRMNLLTMELLVAHEMPLDTPAKLFASGYYFYEWLAFENRMKRASMEAKITTHVAQLAGYLAALHTGAERLTASGYDDKVKSVRFLPDAPEKFRVVFMPLTGTHHWDKRLATAVAYGMELGPLLMTMVNGDVAGTEKQLANIVTDAGSALTSMLFVGGRTWHHNEVMGVMEWVRSEDNNPPDAPRHTGAAAFWAWIHGLNKYPS
jgi:RHS repeat-associated protein/fibro-slime domain-containing protein